MKKVINCTRSVSKTSNNCDNGLCDLVSYSRFVSGQLSGYKYKLPKHSRGQYHIMAANINWITFKGLSYSQVRCFLRKFGCSSFNLISCEGTFRNHTKLFQHTCTVSCIWAYNGRSWVVLEAIVISLSTPYGNNKAQEGEDVISTQNHLLFLTVNFSPSFEWLKMNNFLTRFQCNLILHYTYS